MTKRALIVEDGRTAAIDAATWFRGEGFAVFRQTSFRGARALLSGIAFDAALIDLWIPEGDGGTTKASGIELAGLVRAALPLCRVALWSASPRPEDVAEARRHGFALVRKGPAGVVLPTLNLVP